MACPLTVASVRSSTLETAGAVKQAARRIADPNALKERLIEVAPEMTCPADGKRAAPAGRRSPVHRSARPAPPVLRSPSGRTFPARAGRGFLLERLRKASALEASARFS